MEATLPGADAKSVSILTLGVKDVARSVAFYEALGWEYSPDSDGACTYVLSTNIAIGLVPLDFLAREIGLPLEPIPRYNGLLLAINGASPEEVDAIFQRAVAAGADRSAKAGLEGLGRQPGLLRLYYGPRRLCLGAGLCLRPPHWPGQPAASHDQGGSGRKGTDVN